MKNFKKLFLITFFLVVFVSFLGIKAPNVQAITIAELQVQIQALLTQITQHQKQLAEIQEGTPIAWCHNFNVNLRIGDSGTEIGELKTALIKDGVWPYQAVSYEFDEETASYVTTFQEKYASEVLAPWGLQHGTGFVGGTTRAKLNQLYGCGATTTTCTDSDGGKDYYRWGRTRMGDALSADVCLDNKVLREFYCDSGTEFAEEYTCPSGCEDGACKEEEKSITVLSPNGGEIWEIGTQYEISWESNGIDVNSPVGITLIDYERNKEYGTTGWAKIGDGKFITSWGAAFPISVPSSDKYKIRVSVATKDITALFPDESDNYFSIVEPITTTGSNCQELSDLTSGILKEKGSMGCSNEDYNSYADINKDGWIVPQDALLIGHKVYSVSQEESETWCLEKLNDDTNPCASPTGMESIENQLANISKIISELVEAIK